MNSIARAFFVPDVEPFYLSHKYLILLYFKYQNFHIYDDLPSNDSKAWQSSRVLFVNYTLTIYESSRL